MISRVIDLMTTNETFWFRDTSCWNTLEKHILPDLFARIDNGEKEIRVWSAASATGQEPYSLAILIDQLCRRRGFPPVHDKFKILATDISKSALETARKATYDGFNIRRGLSDKVRDNYFEPFGEYWCVKPEIVKRVEFREFNLLDPLFSLGKFHLILCRNVAIYFSPDFKTNLFKKLNRVMHSDGFLMMGATESMMAHASEFKSVEFKGGVYYNPAKR